MEVPIMILSTMAVKQPWTWLKLIRPAELFLREKHTKLTCIADDCCKKFGLPYLRMVLKSLEKYISML